MYEELVQLLPPPDVEVAGPPWDEIESALGFRPPADYRWFCDTYGGGSLFQGASVMESSEFEIFAPTSAPRGRCPAGLAGLREYHMAGFHESFTYDGADLAMWNGAPYPVYPEPGGVLGWGMSEWGDSFFWLMRGEDPDAWPVVAWMRDPAEAFTLDCGFVEFLRRVVTGEFPWTPSWAGPDVQWHMRSDWRRKVR
ncbi:hypothetical protein KDL01_01270 [Actinospica durhamensis]|uniref:Knr4/Smi1-like domain-containing protein n=1 Tax=Actinospica durhamensis TaxID=1508375 RepID=A0A941ILL9_9ACTN|nr:hypothetical protein [Actinospica durhamensis]MBR7831869.1 hypothetical protein [Actinospica durhamensis]